MFQREESLVQESRFVVHLARVAATAQKLHVARDERERPRGITGNERERERERGGGGEGERLGSRARAEEIPK